MKNKEYKTLLNHFSCTKNQICIMIGSSYSEEIRLKTEKPQGIIKSVFNQNGQQTPHGIKLFTSGKRILTSKLSTIFFLPYTDHADSCHQTFNLFIKYVIFINGLY